MDIQWNTFLNLAQAACGVGGAKANKTAREKQMSDYAARAKKLKAERKQMEDFDKTRDAFEKKALAGDGAFAIALAILELSDAQRDVAKKLHDLGYGDGEGCLEVVGREMARVANVFENHWGAE
jgi:hypothetical protein